MTAWIDLAAVGKIAFFGLLVGALLPAAFAYAVRLNTAGAGTAGVRGLRLLYTGLGWVLISLVVLVAVLGVLFIARDFIGAHTGWFILGAKHR